MFSICLPLQVNRGLVAALWHIRAPRTLFSQKPGVASQERAKHTFGYFYGQAPLTQLGNGAGSERIQDHTVASHREMGTLQKRITDLPCE